jgi:hypothetical protein
MLLTDEHFLSFFAVDQWEFNTPVQMCRSFKGENIPMQGVEEED